MTSERARLAAARDASAHASPPASRTSPFPRPTTQRPRYAPIGDYAIIGDTRTAALVSKHGSIDWLCLPRIDSPSVFAAILDRDMGGSWDLSPGEPPLETTWRYLPQTNVLETTHRTAGGSIRVTDAMIAGLPDDQRVTPDHEIVRVVECLQGEVEVLVRCEPRPDYGRGSVKLRQSPLGWWVDAAGQSFFFCAECETRFADLGRTIIGRRRLRAGERMSSALTHCMTAPAVLPLLADDAPWRIDRTSRLWRSWSGQMRYDGPWREWVQRSALALKLLCFAPSGAVVAAATCSLPEEIGGERNWDYRYCWLRDASLTISALLGLGFQLEAEAFLSWLLYATRLTQPRLRVLYDVEGTTSVDERILGHFEGYRRSRPVRVGNAAVDQLQLDVYGAVLDAALLVVESNHWRLDRKTRRMLIGFGEVAMNAWREPDAGIWESRGPTMHHTLSKAMCWVTLDRLRRLHDKGALRLPDRRFGEEADAIADAVRERGWSDRLGSYTQCFDDERLDASVLLLGIYGFEDPRSERMRRTADRIYDHLGVGPFLHRYRHEEVHDGLGGGEATFGICGFWGVHLLALQDRLEEAEANFQTLLTSANDLGLFSEEYAPQSRERLGNLPQAFTHVGLINAALAIEGARQRKDRPR